MLEVFIMQAAYIPFHNVPVYVLWKTTSFANYEWYVEIINKLHSLIKSENVQHVGAVLRIGNDMFSYTPLRRWFYDG